jgi:hypothetical protein
MRPLRDGGLTVATEVQRAADRRNGRKSTGPRSSRNSFRHGLSRPAALGQADEARIERFALEEPKIVKLPSPSNLGARQGGLTWSFFATRARAAKIERLNAELDQHGSKCDWLYRMVHKHFLTMRESG